MLILAKGKTATGRAWVYVRDDAPSAAFFYASRSRIADTPRSQLAGLLPWNWGPPSARLAA